MRKISGFLLIVIASLLFITGCDNNKVKNSNLVRFSYSYGSFNGGTSSYEIKKQDKKVYLIAKGYNGVDLNIDKEIDSSYLKDIKEVIDNDKIYKWDGFSYSDDNVLDGYSFVLVAEYDNGETIEASGYMKYPNNYDEAHKDLVKVIKSIK